MAVGINSATIVAPLHGSTTGNKRAKHLAILKSQIHQTGLGSCSASCLDRFLDKIMNNMGNG